MSEGAWRVNDRSASVLGAPVSPDLNPSEPARTSHCRRSSVLGAPASPDLNPSEPARTSHCRRSSVLAGLRARVHRRARERCSRSKYSSPRRRAPKAKRRRRDRGGAEGARVRIPKKLRRLALSSSHPSHFCPPIKRQKRSGLDVAGSGRASRCESSAGSSAGTQAPSAGRKQSRFRPLRVHHERSGKLYAEAASSRFRPAERDVRVVAREWSEAVTTEH